MEHFVELINLVDDSIKHNIKEGDYIKLMKLITDIYRTKEVANALALAEDDLTDEEESNNVYGDYNDIYSD